MKWSIKIARLAGIDVRLHITFLLLLVWIALSHYLPTQDVNAAIAGVVLIVLVFASVVLHELGHSLVARRFGITTRDITLLPIGGVASLERMPDDPRQEFWVAVAGPLVNVVIAASCFGLVALIGRLALPVHPQLPGASLLVQLAWINVSLAVFNMLPAFPMDGGRVLRALLALHLGTARATEIAARIGQTLAMIFGLIGLFVSPLLVFVALFVWVGAQAENRASQLNAAMEGMPVEYAMIRDVTALSPRQPLTVAVEQILEGFQQDFPVVDGGRLVGVLSRERLLSALASEGTDVAIGAVMETEFVVTYPTEMLVAAYERLASCPCHSMPVVDRLDRVVGMLTNESVSELLLVQAAIREHRARQLGARASSAR